MRLVQNSQGPICPCLQNAGLRASLELSCPQLFCVLEPVAFKSTIPHQFCIGKGSFTWTTLTTTLEAGKGTLILQLWTLGTVGTGSSTKGRRHMFKKKKRFRYLFYLYMYVPSVCICALCMQVSIEARRWYQVP